MKKKIILSVLLLFFLCVQIALAKVNVNTDDVSWLEELKGIGPVKAAAIIEYREEHGNFTSIEDLAKVYGIGAGIMDVIRDEIDLTSKRVSRKSTTKD